MPQPLPQPLGPADNAQIGQALVYLVLFVALTINASFALLLGWGLLPSLVATADIPADLLGMRRLLLPIGLASAALMALALWRGLTLAVEVANLIYPRSAS
jgi:hypothetical protein